ncbi:hypothetical protein LUZ63_011506 [Rhynchospora breviuscula]|uniref:COP1-interacting protein 7 n=1 Tax=Rhynchospora breviuscula TaxID=2022672 RepID=A0A9Q0CJ02_9POAL|nr:hypothetical protein LUZ63_011506 [Rhynchospora breviuscula]
MKSEVRLDSAVFQLTPTRTRCDLVIHANGKSEKIASGLLNPFLAHLKVAQDQIAKGGYSITLEPNPHIDATWFTKGTVERFVRFVSTPEILERVTTIESEILQIEEAIAVQSSDSIGVGNGEDHQQRSAEFTEGTNADGDKAIVVYKPGSQPQVASSNGSTNQEENSKVQLLKVLETRRNVLRKEQGMAFARAVAAGFDMDTLPYLVAFSECFGASRLMKASSQFMELWRRKHETGQWVEVEAIDNMSMRSELPPFNMPAILLAGDHAKPNLDGTDQHNPDGSAKPDLKNPHEYFQGQFYPPWSMPYPPPYPMQGVPYYQNYPHGGAHSYYPSPYPPTEEHHHHSRTKRHSKSSSKDSDSKSHEGTEHASSESDQEANGSSQGHKNKKGSKKKKKSNMVVIKNLNYITKKLAGSDSGSGSGSDSESDKSDRSDSDKDSTDSDTKESRKKHKKSSKKKEKHRRKPEDSPRDARNRDNTGFEEPQMEGDSGHWQAFQSFLLKADEKAHTNDGDMFSSEREPVPSRRREKGGNAAEPFLPSERDYVFSHERSSAGFDSANGSISRVRQLSSNDEMLMSGENGFADNRFKEIEGSGARVYRRPGAGDDHFIGYGQEKQMVSMGHDIDPLAESRYKQSNLDNNKSYGVSDESFMLAMRSGLHDSVGSDIRGSIDIDSELPKGTNDSATKVASQVFYEPEELTMIPDRGFEPMSAGYDPAIDYESQVHIEKVVKVEEMVEESSPGVQVEKLSAEKDKKVRKSQDGVLDKRRKDALIRRLSGGSTSRASPLTEAQKRAQNLRSYKADLQKLKKEQEEEQIKRLEALKLERQKRIAARSNNANPTQQVKPKPTSKPTQKTSKFTDSDPNSTPARKVVTKTTPTKSTGSGNGLTRSVSSLSDTRKEKNGSGESKRLSEPIRSSTVVKKRSGTGATKSSGAKETQTKKISAILQLDQSKSATLPELKIKNNKDNPSPALEFSHEKVENEMVIEKNVVTLENEVATSPKPVPVQESYMAAQVHSEVEKSEVYEREQKMDKVAAEEQYVAVRAPPSPVLVSEVISGAMESRRGTSEVVKREELSVDAPNTESDTPIERPYQAPMARLTSMEEVHPVSTIPEYETPVPVESVQMSAPVVSSDLVLVNQILSQETIVEKTKGKESKGGFRKLLKFGRKNHAGDGVHTESDASSVDDAANSSHDAHLLKNLITQDDTKVSKSFSLLSPFRKDKKVIVL